MGAGLGVNGNFSNKTRIINTGIYANAHKRVGGTIAMGHENRIRADTRSRFNRSGGPGFYAFLVNEPTVSPSFMPIFAAALSLIQTGLSGMAWCSQTLFWVLLKVCRGTRP